ncbi:MAG TPA: hypothetical protein VML54_17095 [Candidatus Limnocylindrales bacterium]|nr:hypothetical protein [Candidatus Limnocylindrales bacterium]
MSIEQDPSLHSPEEATRLLLRRIVATLAYRAAKVLKDPPEGFGSVSFGAATRRPVRIVAHLADLMTWAVGLAHAVTGGVPPPPRYHRFIRTSQSQ